MQTAKSIYEKCGASVHTHRLVAGSDGNAVMFSSTVDDWGAWAKAAKAFEGNADFQAFERLNANDPASEVISTGIIESFEIPS